MCLCCREQPHTENDCEYPNSCTCQHRFPAAAEDPTKINIEVEGDVNPIRVDTV